MIIKTAKFVVSNTDYKKCPDTKLPEYAFIGRSNVGKSSLINMLTNHSKLAKTSGRPGKTQLINHFLINEQWYLVDLPGYGYAKVSKESRADWEQMISDYLVNRENLYNVFVLIDSRLSPQAIDLEFLQWLGENQIPFSIIFTKADKLSVNKVQSNVSKFKKAMLQTWEALPQIFVTSSVSQKGKEEVLDYIDQINQAG
ncbi:MAG: ribosome biogenesis GTP-binding protein YihA/YsxC [Cyclobacteriaceae bacterium]